MSAPRPAFTASNLGDVINALPALFGFPPQNSLVTLGMHGRRIAFGMRLDLHDVAVDDVEKTAAFAVSHVEQEGADGAIVLAIGEPLHLGRRLVLAVEARLVRVRPVAGGWATDDRYWVSMPGGSPRGYPYRRSLEHPASVGAVLAGQEIVESRESIEASMAPIEGVRRTELEALGARTADGIRLPSAPYTQRRVAAHLAADVVPVLHDLRDSQPVSDEQLLRLGFLITRINIRDEAWGLITEANARDFVRIWLHVARHVPRDWAPASYCLAAFASWLSGDGAKAVMAAEQALRIDGDYSMARLMIDLATCGMNPKNWVPFEAS